MHGLLSTIVVEEEEEEVGPTGGTFFLSSNSGLDLVEGVAAGGGSICGGGNGGTPGGGDGNDGGSQYWNSNYGSEIMDLYYQNMITANPENPLFLSNYARFLKEVHFYGSRHAQYSTKRALKYTIFMLISSHEIFIETG